MFGLLPQKVCSSVDMEFLSACSTQADLSKVQQLVHQGVDAHMHDDAAFCLACGEGHLAIAQYLYNVGGVNVHAHQDFAFVKAMTCNHAETGKWLYMLDNRFSEHVHDRCFMWLVLKTGNLALAQWVESMGGVVDLHALKDVCKLGRLEMAQWLHARGADVRADADAPLRYACKYTCEVPHPRCEGRGRQVVQWLVSKGAAISGHAFDTACAQGCFCTAQWLYVAAGETFGPHVINRAFSNACRSGRIDLARWVFALTKITPETTFECFDHACLTGNLPLSQWLFSIQDADADADEMKRIAQKHFRGMHVDMAQWVFSLGPSHLLTREWDVAFVDACWRGCLPTAQWLMSVSVSVVSVSIDAQQRAFDTACMRGWMGLAQWLFHAHDCVYDAALFQTVVQQNHLDLAKWLYGLGKVTRTDIHANGDELFQSVCERGFICTARWLLSLEDGGDWVWPRHSLLQVQNMSMRPMRVVWITTCLGLQ